MYPNGLALIFYPIECLPEKLSLVSKVLYMYPNYVVPKYRSSGAFLGNIFDIPTCRSTPFTTYPFGLATNCNCLI